MSEPMTELRNVEKTYDLKAGKVWVLRRGRASPACAPLADCGAPLTGHGPVRRP